MYAIFAILWDEKLPQETSGPCRTLALPHFSAILNFKTHVHLLNLSADKIFLQKDKEKFFMK